ncbi:MAG TPA: hypothetical protein VGB73_19165 [Pyrinomonadaceae bacterium]
MSSESGERGGGEGVGGARASGDASGHASEASREAPPSSGGASMGESRTPPPSDATIERWAERISSSLKDESGARQDEGAAHHTTYASESRSQPTANRASDALPATPPNRERGSQPEARQRIEQSGQPGAAGAFGEVVPEAPERARRRTVTAVQESVRPRVEKLRDASMGMIEEASEDTGLRFVLIAFALFVVSVVLLALHSVLN